MKRLFLFACLGLLVAGLAGAAIAQTSYDLANHLLLKPGQWQIEESRPLGQPQAPVHKVAIVVTQQGPFILQNEWDWNGKAWVPSDILIYKVTATHVELHGWYDPVSTRYGLFAVPMRVPRYMKVHEPFTYKGTMIEGARSTPITFCIEVTADKITRKVKSGTYTGCIRLKVTTVTNDSTEHSSEILAPGYGRIASIESELDETEPEPQMLGADIYERSDPKKP